MAATNKRKQLTGKEKMSNSKGPDKENNSVAREIKLLIFLGVCLLIFLGNFGWAGIGDTGINWISSHIRGIIGFIQFFLPVFLFVSALYLYFNPDNSKVKFKIILTSLLFFICMVLIHMFHGSGSMNWEIKEYFSYGMENIFSGGVLGGLIATLFYNIMGIAGSLIVLIIAAIIIGIMLTDKSFINQVRRAGHRSSEALERETARKKNVREQKRNTYNGEADKYVRKQKKTKPEFELKEPENKAKSLTFERKEKQLPIKNEDLSEEMHEVFSDSKDFDETDYVFTIQRDGNSSILGNTNNTIPEFKTNEKHDTDFHKKKEEKENKNKDIIEQISNKISEPTADEYVMPSVDLLKENKNTKRESDSYLRERGIKLQKTLQSFGVNVTVTNVSCGPSVTRYELQPEQGVKVSKITNLADDIKLNLAVSDIRIEAPIPGKAAVGIEVPNTKASPVLIRELLESKQFMEASSPLTFVVGKDISGNIIVGDIAKMPHLLVAGATGSGKSVCINTIIMSLLFKAHPSDVKLILIDPKVVELSVYNGIPHMYIPVVTDPKKAAGALNWAVAEMDDRYNKMSEVGVRDLDGYNRKIAALPDSEDKPEPFSRLVIIVDELADLMMVCGNEVEAAICRLAQKARAAGIHLILATQRPSVDVITGLIKANMPSRIAFAVASGTDSRTIIDINGAEKLLGKGDMLFYPSGYPKPVRVQGAFVSDKEVSDVVGFLSEQNSETVTSKEIEERMNAVTVTGLDSVRGDNSGYDDYFVQAGQFVIEKGKASTSMIQRVFKVGFNRAARIMDQLEEAGVVGSEEGTKPRKVIMSEEQFEQFVEESV